MYQTMTTNIGDSIDPFYRYKRPIATVENRSSKTIITNLDAIAKALHTKATYILYYIQLEKSTSISTNGEIKCIINKSDIEIIIDKFIAQYILCNVCNYPELVTQQATNKKLYFSCNACGQIIDIPVNKFTKIMYKDFK